jgi:LuxR family maltose regulon positive regulatory protein
MRLDRFCAWYSYQIQLCIAEHFLYRLTFTRISERLTYNRSMAMPVLATKLFIPPPRPKVVLRPRLIDQLNEGLHAGHKLTLISAPVGYGKTTLISEWAARCRRSVAWLSLDEGDSDLTRFLAYIIAALQTISANIGKGVAGILQPAQPAPTEPILTALLNEITTIRENFILVLDDYHVIDSKPIGHSILFLIEHLPPQMHLVISTREDPGLPLASLRARDQLTELRATDLRFTPAEAAEFLNQVMGLNLSAEDIAALEARTEGWIAGLQLAALSTRGRGDVHGFITAFAGDNRYIVDYLVEEVLRRQPERVRRFLLETSILDWLSGPLCDAVTDQKNSNVLLEALERGNLFVTMLDDKRQWFRYHQLFTEVLHAHLIAELPDRVPTLHRRASEWYEHNGSAMDAIRHALAAGDFERVADLVELAVPEMRRNRQESTLLGWLQALPDELLHFRPVLSVHYAGALLLSRQLESVDARLLDAERWLDTTISPSQQREASPPEMVVIDEAEFRRLPGWIAIYRAARALALGDVDDTKEYARQALNILPEEDHLGSGAAAGFLGLAYWTSGELEAAHCTFAGGMTNLQKAGYLSDIIGSAIILADIRIAQGCLNMAMSTYRRGLKFGTEPGTPVLRGAADMHVGMSEIYYERNDLHSANQHLLRSKELGEFAGLPKNPYRWRVAMARIRQAQGDLDGALSLLHEAQGLYVGDFSPNVRPVAALKTRVWIAQVRLGEALDWAREQGLSAEDNLSYLHEFEHITLARVLLAMYRRDRADRYMLETMGLLERLLRSAEAYGSIGSAIEILLLQALAHHAQDDLPAALLLLQQALRLAEPEGYIRIFVDEGEPMRSLIADFRSWIETQSCGQDRALSGYIDRLLAAFTPQAAPPQSNIRHQNSTLVGQLSQRELEILRLIAQGLSNHEISERLFVALNTVKGHNQKIFGKLQVQSRTEAIARARELDLL